tara:strand:+ start:4526 stop:5479 length:954 start_codon:yes stop_codon:yes gene_type:complete
VKVSNKRYPHHFLPTHLHTFLAVSPSHQKDNDVDHLKTHFASIRFYPLPRLSHSRKMTTNLFSMPPEVRDEIYRHLWASTIYIRFDCIGNSNFELRSGSLWDATTRNPPHWLLTSKAVLDEGLDHFQRTRTIKLQINNAYWWARNVFEPQMFMPLSPLRIRKLQLDCLVPAQRVQNAAPARPNDVQVTSFDYVARLLGEIANGGKLHSLSLTVHVEQNVALHHTACDTRGFHAAIAGIAPQLRSLEVHIMMGRRWPTVPSSSIVGTLENVVGGEMRKVEAGGMRGLVEQHGGDIVQARVRGTDGRRTGVMGWRFIWS